MAQETTRLAPSPTGAMHLGNVRTFLVNWALAKQRGQQVLLRIEDLDGPRVKRGAAARLIDDLAWLGLDWDGQVTYQGDNLSFYREALERLHSEGLIYPCCCTRSQIRAALSAPHGEHGEVRYPGTCRPDGGDGRRVVISTENRGLEAEGTVAWRVVVPDETIGFTDEFHGDQKINVHEQIGDFIVSTKAGVPAYQLAVVVDDARQGVTSVVRGDDLLGCTGRQLLLYRLFGVGAVPGIPGVPGYVHLPMVVGQDGRRLAKRHGDTRVEWYRKQGVESSRIVGLMGYWSGVADQRVEMNAGEFAKGFKLARVPRGAITFTAEDHAWLLEK